MHPYTAEVLSQAHIADLHRAAARDRRARTVTPHRRGIRTAMADRVGAVRLAVAGWITDRTQPAPAEPACCPG